MYSFVFLFFFRPNIFLSVSFKGTDIRRDLQSHMTQQGSKFHFEGPTIIYCPTKKMTDQVAQIVNGKLLFGNDSESAAIKTH